MDYSETLRENIRGILDTEPDSESPVRDWPHPRLQQQHNLDPSYLLTYDWEGSTIHPSTRVCSANEQQLAALTRNVDVPISLFESALRLMGDSILAYDGVSTRTGPLAYYPSIVLTFWSGFETFVRYSSELFLVVCRTVPSPIVEFLQEFDADVNQRGEIVTRGRFRPVLERYAVLLKHGYGFQVDRGSKYWQLLNAARDLRDYYTHLDVTNSRSIATTQVFEFMEAVLLGIIWPSCEIERTQIPGIYNVYRMWDSLRELADEYVEQPAFVDWPWERAPYMFYCPFKNVNNRRFPNSREETRRLQRRQITRN